LFGFFTNGPRPDAHAAGRTVHERAGRFGRASDAALTPSIFDRQFVLHEAIHEGRGKVKAGDSLWLVSGPDLPAGTRVRVTGQDGVILKVEACQ
jgi:membrane protein implicated in regulation of membrane protease activity